MITIILPGYSASNKEWVMEAAEEMALEHEARPILWDHWNDPLSPFKPAEKLDKVKYLVGKEKFNLLAKSIGTLVAVMAISDMPRQINKVILCGLPLRDLKPDHLAIYKQVLGKVQAKKVIIFQNSDDPHGTFSEVEKLVREVNPKIKIASKVRADHDYPYFEEFKEILSAEE